MGGKIELTGPDLEADGMAAAEIGAGKVVVGHARGEPVVLVRRDGEIRAVGGKCTHYGAPLGDGLFDGRCLRCPWHHARFDVVTGEAVGGPALASIPRWRLEQRDGRVFVTDKIDEPPPRPRPAREPESVVILGAGAAGEAAAEALRRGGYGGPVVLLGEEIPVDRPNLSKDYLAGNAPEEWVPLRSDSFFRDHDIELRLEHRAAAIDRLGRVVRLANGDRVAYDALLYAPGAEPVRLPIPGAERHHVHTLRSLADCRALIAAAEGAERAIVIGAGFIGLEVAASLRQRDVPVTVVAPEELPLARLLGEHLGRFVRSIHEEHGVEFRLERTVSEIAADRVTLDDGSEIEADLVVMGVGVRPRVELAEAAGLEVDRGVVVDDRLRTSDPSIWAAGDVARFPWRGESVRVEHWVVAQRQGQAAARNILGADEPFRDAPFFWSQHYDVPIAYVGHAAEVDRAVVRGSAAERDVLVTLERRGEILAVASIYRDLDNLRAEVALEEGSLDRLEL
jgi:NADPH-dependent 2,4-dienoyl-CoA reductase/sulfur reductase-like enzyme/nitrite reductase/ring-hydroxylating ferredoxin subunit